MKKITKEGALLAALGLGLAGRSDAQPAGGETVRQDFEDNAVGWVKFGEGTQVGISREAENVHGGAASLQFNYTVAPRQIGALALADTAPLARASTISFWAKCSAETTMAFAVQERGGGLWLALFHLPENQWQQVTLTPRDFINGLGPNDPRDPDGKLSLDRLEWAGLGDFAQFLLLDPNSPLLKLFRVTQGPRALWLDDVVFDPARPVAETNAGANAANTIPLEDFSTPQLNWVPLAGAQISRDEREAGGAKRPGLQMEYTQALGQIGGVARRVNSAGWAGASKLSLRLASDKPADIALQLEERGGGKYFVPIKAAGDGEAKALSFDLTQFQPTDDSKDGNGRLDIDQVHQMILLDLAAIVPGAAAGNNSLWVGDISLQK